MLPWEVIWSFAGFEYTVMYINDEKYWELTFLKKIFGVSIYFCFSKTLPLSILEDPFRGWPENESIRTDRPFAEDKPSIRSGSEWL